MKTELETLISIRSKLKKELDPARYEHTLGVAYTASMMARVHESDADKALLAGMLHDCAKCLSHEKRIAICEKNGVEIKDVERRNHVLLHSKCGKIVAHKKYGINDEDILNAISSHTTGRPGMSKLEKIVFIADYIEPGRTSAPNLYEVRKLAFEDLDKTLIKILSDTLEYLQKNGKEIDPMTQETYDYYTQEETYE